MKLTLRTLFAVTVLVTSAATTACVGVYDTGAGPSNPTSTYVATTPVYPTYTGAFVGGPLFAGWSAPSPSDETSPTLFGTAAPFARVDLYGDAACYGLPIATVFADANGHFQVTLAVAPNATTYVTAAATDENGQWLCSSPISYTHQDTFVGVPAQDPAYAPSTDVCGVVSGYSVPGNTVALHDDDACGATVLATTVADENGYFAVSLCASGFDVTARSIDAYGQSSTCSAPIAVELQ